MINQFFKPALLLVTFSVWHVACDTEPDTFEATGDVSYFVPAGDEPIRFQVDSVIYDPSVSGTDRIMSSSIWTLEPVQNSIDSEPFFVSVEPADTTGSASQRYIWDFQSYGISDGSHITQLDGFSYVNLVTPFTNQSSWDALQFADPNLEISVAGEPLRIHKDWTIAVIDSIGLYSLPNGTSIDAVFVSLTSSENAIELREFKEVYGKGYGLLERSQRFLDTQQSASTEAWEDKAERGFTVYMKRLF